MRLLIVGAKPNSLGEALATVASSWGFTVITAGISGEEEKLDVRWYLDSMTERMAALRPDYVVVTAGINGEAKEYQSLGALNWARWYEEHFAINTLGPLNLLQAWLSTPSYPQGTTLPHYVAISSNSAHIARTGSGAYCASKAALSMALRCQAREMARRGLNMVVYGYEPGLLAGTPMTEQVADRLAGIPNFDRGAVPLHRMPGVLPDGIPPAKIANLILHNLRHGGRELNGTMIRVDAGEQ